MRWGRGAARGTRTTAERARRAFEDSFRIEAAESMPGAVAISILDDISGDWAVGYIGRIRAIRARCARTCTTPRSGRLRSTHTQTDDQAEIINVTREEAEWTLDVVDRLFDYFIVAPAKDKALHETWDEKLKATGRKPIPPLPEDVT
jgi:hypothetical protein